MSSSDLSTQNFIDCCQLAGKKAVIKLPGKLDYPAADGYAVPSTPEFLELKKNKFQLFRVNRARSSPQNLPERQIHTVSLCNSSGYILIQVDWTPAVLGIRMHLWLSI